MPDGNIPKPVQFPQRANHAIEFEFGEQIRCVIINGVPHWSILDTYKIYGKSSNPTRDWKRDKAELEEQGLGLPILVGHIFQGQEGNRNKQSTPVTTLQGFMRIAQVAKFKEWEPLRMKMAELMAQYLRQNFRRDPVWVQTYSGERVSHEHLMDALEEAVWFICRGYHYEEAAEAVFEGLYKRTRGQIKDQIGLPHKYRLEEHQSLIALSYQTIAKALASEELDGRSELSFEEAKAIILGAAAFIAPQIEAVSRARGIDVPTNLPLLPHRTTPKLDHEIRE
jgi:hypothetical protein